MQRVAEVMAEGLDIRYHRVVVRIDWGESGATVHCSDGMSLKCDAVICTVSLGVLKVRTEHWTAAFVPFI